MFGKIIAIFTVLLLALIFIGGPVVSIVGWHHETGAGSQVGYVSAVEKEGFFFKTGRAYIKPTLESTQEDTYCVIDEDVYLDLKARSVSKERIEVSHVSYAANGVTKCAGENAVITAVKVIE